MQLATRTRSRTHVGRSSPSSLPPAAARSRRRSDCAIGSSPAIRGGRAAMGVTRTCSMRGANTGSSGTTVATRSWGRTGSSRRTLLVGSAALLGGPLRPRPARLAQAGNRRSRPRLHSSGLSDRPGNYAAVAGHRPLHARAGSALPDRLRVDRHAGWREQRDRRLRPSRPASPRADRVSGAPAQPVDSPRSRPGALRWRERAGAAAARYLYAHRGVDRRRALLDPKFNTADLFVLMPLERVDARYARRFLRAAA